MSEVWEIPVVFPFRWYWEARISSGQQLFCAIRRFIVLAQGLTAFLTAPAHLASYLEAASTSHSAFTHSLFVNGPWLAVDQCRTGVIYYLATFLNKKKKISLCHPPASTGSHGFCYVYFIEWVFAGEKAWEILNRRAIFLTSASFHFFFNFQMSLFFPSVYIKMDRIFHKYIYYL